VQQHRRLRVILLARRASLDALCAEYDMAAVRESLAAEVREHNDNAARLGRYKDIEPVGYDGPPSSRSERRGHDVEWADFLRLDQWHLDHGFTSVEVRAAIAAWLAWLSTLTACGLPAPHEWGIPADEPTSPRPVELLTPRQPHAPDTVVVQERRAA
jgi:hypothetical protein